LGGAPSGSADHDDGWSLYVRDFLQTRIQLPQRISVAFLLDAQKFFGFAHNQQQVRLVVPCFAPAHIDAVRSLYCCMPNAHASMSANAQILFCFDCHAALCLYRVGYAHAV